MYCQDCGTGNTVDSKYCKECGEKINDGYRTMMLSVQDLPVGQSDEEVERLTRLLDMAFWHNQAGNRGAAVTAAEAALAINPRSTTAHSLLGTLYEKSGDDAEAIRHFEAVLALNPDSAADAAKLDQVRRGVHVRAAAPPLTHQWLPPAFLRLAPQVGRKWAASPFPALLAARAGGADPQRRPLYAAGAVTALFLGCGLLVTHPWAQAEAVRTFPVHPSAGSPLTAVRRSAFAAGPQDAAAPPAKPMVLTPSARNTYLAPPAITTRDPFAGPLPASSAPASASPLWALPSVPPRAAARRRPEGRDLPALRLAALPAPNEDGLAPAPVTLPPGVIAPPSAAPVPQHTVVVSSFTPGSPPPELSSHIRITVHQAKDTGGSSDAGDSLGQGGGSADADQQRALSLQQSGDYTRASAAYQSAIRGYQARIAAGQDVDTAQRGLAACQTGLQICQQSQP